MNIKSLLIGSAAALAVVSGAQAADAIVAAEPEPLEYVRVCDAFGTGYFYIPGTETCLKIGGYVRFEAQFSDVDDFDWNWRTRGLVTFDAKSDSEIGTIGSVITLRTWAEDQDSSDDRVELDEAYITAGGFKVGYAYNYWDNDLSGETDDIGSNRLNMIGYEYTADAFAFGIFAEELSQSYSEELTADYAGDDNIGVTAQISGAFGPVNAFLLGSYDFAAENGAIRLLATADLGPGQLGLAGIYSTGQNAYYDVSEWTIAAQYAVAVTDKFSITPGFQYWDTLDVDVDGDFTGSRDAWRAGVTLDYAIAEGLTSKLSVQYTDEDGEDEVVSGFFRLQRSF